MLNQTEISEPATQKALHEQNCCFETMFERGVQKANNILSN